MTGYEYTQLHITHTAEVYIIMKDVKPSDSRTRTHTHPREKCSLTLILQGCQELYGSDEHCSFKRYSLNWYVVDGGADCSLAHDLP